ncbi:carbohydrate esterase family 4 protein [Lyophyllum atratum]|nr:carbohydrate esterase family 4 protein [Lyophyllum atratum]
MFASAIFTLGLVILATASPAKPKRAPAQVITRCTVPNTAALTFDDGPWIYLEEVANTLKAAGVLGTFFFNGDNYDCIYDPEVVTRVKFAYDQGHQIGSHTWSHPHLTTLDREQITSQFSRIEVALQKITGAVPAFTRPPYGETNQLVLEVASDRGQSLVNWDFDSGDSIGKTAAQSEALYDDLVERHPSTILALNHEVYATTARIVLPHALKKLQGAGYKLVTVAECLGRNPYKYIGQPFVRDDSWTCE